MISQSATGHSRPQRHAIILCHPSEHSFNAAVANAYCDAVRALGHETVFRDLYRSGFDPILKMSERPGPEFEPAADVVAEINALRGADIFVLVYPLWFGSPPAVMKGYVERVLGAGFSDQAIRAHHSHDWLSNKHLLSIATSGGTAQWQRLRGALRPLREAFDNYIAEVFSMRSSDRLDLDGVVEGMDPARAEAKLQTVRDYAAATCGRLCIADHALTG